MSVYNGRSHLAAAVDSILAQTFAGFEFLIVDDGSTDGSGEMLEAYARRDPRIRLFRRENRGLARSLNELIVKARGVYLARMDADDVSQPDRFAAQVAHLDAHPQVAILGGNVLYCTSDMRPIFSPRPPARHEEIDASNLKGQAALIHPTVMMRSDFVRSIGGYDESYRLAQDIDLWLRAAEHGRLANLEKIVLHYRMTEEGASGRQVERQSAFAKKACRSAWKRRGLPRQEMVEGRWRPLASRASRQEFALQWAWQAWNSGYTSTARYYFLKALRLNPFSRAAWHGIVFGGFRRPV